MFARLLLAFIAIPLIELVLLLRMAEATSWWTTLMIVVATGLLGSLLARREGVAAIRRFQAALSEGRMPGQEIQDGLMIAFAAALLLTPGLLTDGLGFALLTPPGRRIIGGLLRRRYAGRFQLHTSGFGQRPSEDQRSSGGFPNSGWGGPVENGTDTVDSPNYGPKQGHGPKQGYGSQQEYGPQQGHGPQQGYGPQQGFGPKQPSQ